jgi:hypothetical protein
LTAIGAFITDDLSALDHFGGIDAQSAAFTRDVVLRVVEAIGPQMTDGTESAAVVESIHTLCSILYDQEIMLCGDRHKAIHSTRDTSVMDREDGLRPWGDGCFG